MPRLDVRALKPTIGAIVAPSSALPDQHLEYRFCPAPTHVPMAPLRQSVGDSQLPRRSAVSLVGCAVGKSGSLDCYCWLRELFSRQPRILGWGLPDTQDFLSSELDLTGIDRDIRNPSLPFASKHCVQRVQRLPLFTKTTKSLFATLRALCW